MADKRQKRQFPLHTLKLTPKMAARHMECFLLAITQLGALNIDPQLKGVPEHPFVASVSQWQRAGSVRTAGISPQAWNQPLTFSRHITVACPPLPAFTSPTQPLSHFAPASLARCCSFIRGQASFCLRAFARAVVASTWNTISQIPQGSLSDFSQVSAQCPLISAACLDTP